MSAGPQPSRASSLVRLGSWVGATYVGFATFGDIHLQTSGPTTPLDPRDFEVAVFGFMLGAASGALIGVLQWLVLRAWAPGARWWIPASVIGFGLAHALNDAFPYRPLDLIAMLAIGGVLVSIPQAVALRHVFSRPWTWVPVATVAWIAGWSVCAAVTPFIVRNPLGEMFLAIGSAGLVFGTITGVALLAQIGLSAPTHDVRRPAPTDAGGDRQPAR